jgi:putative flippase GtrA
MAFAPVLIEQIRRGDLIGLARSQFVRFVAVGFTGLAVDTAVFTVLHGQGLVPAAARAGSLAVSTVVTWQLNRRFTFARTGRRKRAEVIRYATVVGVAQAISYSVFLAVLGLFPHIYPVAAILAGAVSAVGFSFGGQRLFTFTHPNRRPGARLSMTGSAP